MEAQLREIALKLVEYITEYFEIVKNYFYKVAEQFPTLTQGIKEVYESIPSKFTITKEQYIILFMCSLCLIFRQPQRAKKTEPQQPQKISGTLIVHKTPKKRAGPKVLGQNWYPTGWTFNEKTKLWEPPDFLIAEASERWVWDPDKGIWIDLYKQKQEE